MNQLIWFELQITPFAFRFAILPKQPILIGFIGKVQKGLTLLILKAKESGAQFHLRLVM